MYALVKLFSTLLVLGRTMTGSMFSILRYVLLLTCSATFMWSHDPLIGVIVASI